VPFSHGGKHAVGPLMLFDSYHCSRYNTNTGVLTTEMFRSVFAAVRAHLDA
jgi:uracil-DNA glycosylase